METIVIRHSGYQIKRGRITRIEELTEKEKLFTVVLPHDEALDRNNFV